ncbi:hypothetical protein EVAR_20276_1 [Eumeta japonica]|uniref:Uncharacterized protein n=1 Tax=Eumeta variegata TaxID=151549 RepID=A0A4C1VQP9_EUMVA|nr:hypothetical protein EVAR_20276_1 [Eumeta japonica]
MENNPDRFSVIARSRKQVARPHASRARCDPPVSARRSPSSRHLAPINAQREEPSSGGRRTRQEYQLKVIMSSTEMFTPATGRDKAKKTPLPYLTSEIGARLRRRIIMIFKEKRVKRTDCSYHILSDNGAESLIPELRIEKTFPKLFELAGLF